jgi:hypothetical protein
MNPDLDHRSGKRLLQSEVPYVFRASWAVDTMAGISIADSLLPVA